LPYFSKHFISVYIQDLIHILESFFDSSKKIFFSYIYIKTAVTPVTPVTPSRNPLLTRVYKDQGVTTVFFWLVTPVTPDDDLRGFSL
jgi:hypothetical protein